MARELEVRLLGKIERHLRATGQSPTRFGREAVRDPRLVGDLKNGREPGAAIAVRILKFIADREGAKN